MRAWLQYVLCCVVVLTVVGVVGALKVCEVAVCLLSVSVASALNVVLLLSRITEISDFGAAWHCFVA